MKEQQLQKEIKCLRFLARLRRHLFVSATPLVFYARFFACSSGNSLTS